jgi:hypothetical protein
VLSINLDIGHIVLENRWDVDLKPQGLARRSFRCDLCKYRYDTESPLWLCDADEFAHQEFRKVVKEPYLWEGTLGKNTAKALVSSSVPS